MANCEDDLVTRTCAAEFLEDQWDFQASGDIYPGGERADWGSMQNMQVGPLEVAKCSARLESSLNVARTNP